MTSGLTMRMATLTAPGPNPWPGRYYWNSTTSTWKRYIRNRYSTVSGTWIPSEYGRSPLPPTAVETWTATPDQPLWPPLWQWQQTGGGSATIVSSVGVLTPGAGAYTAGAQVAFMAGMQQLTDWEFGCTVGFVNPIAEQYVVVGMSAAADRTSGQAVPKDGYSVQFFPNAAGFNVNRSVAATVTNLSGTVAYTYTAGTAVNVQMTKLGGVLQVWVWNVGVAQPATPTWTATDATPFTGGCTPYLCASNGAATTAMPATFDSFNVTPYSLWAVAASNATAMPVGDITVGSQNWHQMYVEDFVTDEAVGAFIPQPSGTNAGYLNQGGAADSAYGSAITVYPEGYGASTYGTSRPIEILDVTGSCLRWNFAVSSTYGNMAATVHPMIGSSYFIDPAGIRIHMRFHLSGSANLAGLGLVIQLISDPTTWASYHGELDAMEGDVSLNAETNWHPQQSTNTTVRWGTQPWTDNWHDLIIEWLPSRETVYIDGVKIGETTTLVSTHPRAFLIQTGWNSVPTSGQSGQLLVDWITAYTPA